MRCTNFRATRHLQTLLHTFFAYTLYATPPHEKITSNLPVLKKAIDTYKIWHGHYANFPRLSKFTLGTKIDTLFTDLIELILLAGYAASDQKYAFVIKASTQLDLLKFFTQVAWEVRCLDHKRYAALCVPLNEIGRDVGGWQKYLQTKQPASK